MVCVAERLSTKADNLVAGKLAAREIIPLDPHLHALRDAGQWPWVDGRRENGHSEALLWHLVEAQQAILAGLSCRIGCWDSKVIYSACFGMCAWTSSERMGLDDADNNQADEHADSTSISSVAGFKCLRLAGARTPSALHTVPADEIQCLHPSSRGLQVYSLLSDALAWEYDTDKYLRFCTLLT